MFYVRSAFIFFFLTALNGCTKTPENPKAPAPQSKAGELIPKDEAKIQAAMAKLAPADRTLAEAQRFCPIQKTRLGIMGKPDRIELEGQVVFLCCDGCAEDARANPKKTLAQVAEFKKK